MPSHYRIFYSFPGNPSTYLGVYDGDGTPKVVAALTINGVQRLLSAGPALVPGQWYHAVAVYDGTCLALYVNGALAGQITGLTGGITLGTAGMIIGGYPTPAYGYSF